MNRRMKMIAMMIKIWTFNSESANRPNVDRVGVSDYSDHLEEKLNGF